VGELSGGLAFRGGSIYSCDLGSAWDEIELVSRDEDRQKLQPIFTIVRGRTQSFFGSLHHNSCKSKGPSKTGTS